LSSGLSKGLQVFVGSMFDLGQNTLDFVVSFFVMLYLLFFLLRDGVELRAASRRRSLPRTCCKARIQVNHVVRARQGNLVVACMGEQGGDCSAA